MRIIWDAQILTMYNLGKPGFHGGTELMIKELVPRLAARGHTVHVVTRDLDVEEQRGPSEFWWPKNYHPTDADVVIETQQILPNVDYNAPKLVLAHTGCDPYLGSNGEWATGVDAWPVFSEEHKRMLLEQRPTIPEDRVFVTGLGINLTDYPLTLIGGSIYGRMLYANDPMRGLFYVLDIFDIVKLSVPEATLHVAYDFDRQYEVHKWEHSYKAQLMMECSKRIKKTPGVISLGAVSKEQMIKEQLECHVHCMPSDPPNIGTQTHGLTQMECAAAGVPLVLSDIEAFPEVFGVAATILPVIGYFDGEHRVDAADYAGFVVELMKDKDKWLEAARKSRLLAEQNTWDKCADNWDMMLRGIAENKPAHMILPQTYRMLYQTPDEPGRLPIVNEDYPRLAWVLDRIKPEDSVLDLGCHKGEFTSHIANRTTGRVVGVDISEQAIKDAQLWYKNTSIEWILGWAEDTKLEPESFDVVVIGELLEHVMDTDRLITEAERVLKPGGTIIISTPKDAALMEERSRKGTEPHRHVREYDPSKELADKLNLETCVISQDEYTWYMASYQKKQSKKSRMKEKTNSW